MSSSTSLRMTLCYGHRDDNPTRRVFDTPDKMRRFLCNWLAELVEETLYGSYAICLPSGAVFADSRDPQRYHVSKKWRRNLNLMRKLVKCVVVPSVSIRIYTTKQNKKLVKLL